MKPNPSRQRHPDPLPEDSRVPPSNLDAERCVIGSVILDARLIEEVGSIIGPKDFHDDCLGALFARLIAMRAANIPSEATLIVEQLKAHGEWWASREAIPLHAEMVDAACLAECCHSVALAAHARYYAEIVSDASYRRRVILAMHGVIERAYNPRVSIADLKNAAMSLLRRIAGDEGAANVKADAQGQEQVPPGTPRTPLPPTAQLPPHSNPPKTAPAQPKPP